MAEQDTALRVCFLTLGCKVNQTESEALAQLFVSEGYTLVKEAENPDIIILNTCTVTGTGSSKSRKLIRKISKEHPLAILAVMGCYSQTKPEEVASLEGVDLILGTQDRSAVLEHIRTIQKQNQMQRQKPISAVQAFSEKLMYEELPLIESESRARAMLKIQDGCSQFCSYCIVPYARGPSRSRQPDKVMAEAKRLLEAGYQEIVLTGIHIGAYGKDLHRGSDLASLVDRLLGIKEMKRLRLGSIEPMEFTPALLDIITSREEICPHFHIPLQSGSDSILEKMKRPYSTIEYAALLARIRERLPDAAIAADIMTGFPGESEQEHQKALQFIASCAFASIHVFPFSRRPGTPAADFPDQVSKQEKSARVRDIMDVGRQSREEYIRRFIDQPIEVLVERVASDGTVQGHTRNYLEIRLPSQMNPGHWQAGQRIDCIFKKEFLIG